MAGGSAKISKSKGPQEKSFAQFLYDSEEGTCLGRTPSSWFKITVFYIIYYTGLAGFFCLNFYIFSLTLNDHSPKWTLDNGIIGSNPGIGFRPMPDQDKNSESTLIWYRAADNDDAKFWYSQLDEVIKRVEQVKGKPGVVTCEHGKNTTTDKTVCLVDTTNLGNCVSDEKYGYPNSKPCVLIKLNKIFDWKPEPYGLVNGQYNEQQLKTDLDEAVENEMPTSLRSHIESEVNNAPENKKEAVLDRVWFSCQGENVGDKENLPVGNIAYHPSRGIPGYYFPFTNQEYYRSPFLMVELDLPPSSKHVLINIECRAWAKNIFYDRQNRLGSVHFELMVD